MKNSNALAQIDCPVAQGIVGFTRFVRDPNRLDTVFDIAESLISAQQREANAKKMRALSPHVDQAFAKRVRITPIRLKDFATYEVDTLGHAYYQFMTSQNLTPDAIPNRQHVTDADYFIASGYETHDIWHVVTGFGTSIAEELGLQGFYTAQTPFGVSEAILFGGFLNALIFNPRDFFNRFREFRRGRKLGKEAKNLFGVNWDFYWGKPLSQVRAEFGIRI
jgi:ubiquinone biosynthesis protein COQ4